MDLTSLSEGDQRRPKAWVTLPSHDCVSLAAAPVGDLYLSTSEDLLVRLPAPWKAD